MCETINNNKLILARIGMYYVNIADALRLKQLHFSNPIK